MATIKVLAESQLHSPTSDGQSDENKWYNCVPATIDMGISAVTGAPLRGADWWKDRAYGQGYVGATAASAYIELANQCGAYLFAIDNSDNAVLVQDIHSQIQQGHPVIATEPDPYAPAGVTGWSHVLLFYSESPGELSVIDPFYGQIITKNDKDWQSILEFHEIWGISKIGEIIPVANTNVPSNWKLSADKKTLTATNGVEVAMGFAQYILSHSWDTANVPLGREYGDGHGGTEQLFMNNVLRWNPKDGVTVGSLGSVVIELESQVATLIKVQDEYKAQIATLQGQVKSVQAGIPPEISSALVSAMHSAADFGQALQAVLNAASAIPAPTVLAGAATQ